MVTVRDARTQNRVVVTGGAGFIGSALVRFLVDEGNEVWNVDKLTYSGNTESLESIADKPNYHFVHGDICDRTLVQRVLNAAKPNSIYHLAAESHVDRSIDGPEQFIHTNIVGTSILLDETRQYWSALSAGHEFRFLHVSTDEVYGSLGPNEFFTEATPYDPSSPYSASKASSDHLARAWHRTYGLPVIVTNCSNNYGPFQFPEKLIPLMILNGLEGKPLPVYGRGDNERDWLFVDDHVHALTSVMAKGRVGATYNIGGGCQMKNIDVVKEICATLDDLRPAPMIGSRKSLIRFVADRPGHDDRYAIDFSRITNELGWKPSMQFAEGLRTTIQWYVTNATWCERVQSGAYRRERLGRGAST